MLSSAHQPKKLRSFTSVTGIGLAEALNSFLSVKFLGVSGNEKYRKAKDY